MALVMSPRHVGVRFWARASYVTHNVLHEVHSRVSGPHGDDDSDPDLGPKSDQVPTLILAWGLGPSCGELDRVELAKSDRSPRGHRWVGPDRPLLIYRGTSVTRKRTPLRPQA